MPKKKLYDEEVTSFRLRIPVDMKERIIEHAKIKRRSMNQEILVLVMAGLEALEKNLVSEPEIKSPPPTNSD